MKKLFSILLFTLLLMFAVGAETLYGTELRTSTADPHLFVHDGYYYLARTGSTRVAVHKATSLLRLSTAYSSTEESIAYDASADPTVETLFGAGATISGTWSPEIHYFSEADFGAENAGWYMFVGLRKKAAAGSVYASEFVRLVVLKSTTGDPAGPYGHPQTGVVNHSMPLLAQSGEIYDEWACGQSILRIPEGKYAGLYAMWVDEVGRGTVNFYQRIRISKMASPWQLTGAVGTVTTPTQDWEFVGSEDGTHPKVVEGATAVYGKNGEVFLTYSGSGYWSDYGIGQLTWNGGDPLSTDSWVKYAHNPIFTATTSTALRGAGHASFLTDTMGNGFFCYHAYPYSALSGKDSARNAYIEPYSIDYTANNGVGKGVLQLGSGVATTASTITFDTSGEALGISEIDLTSMGQEILCTIPLGNAEGYIVYRDEGDGEFTYLDTLDQSNVLVEGSVSHMERNATSGKTYTYRAYPYRNEEIGDTFAEASITLVSIAAPTVSLSTDENGAVALLLHANDNYDGFSITRDFDLFFTVEVPIATGKDLLWADETAEPGSKHRYYIFGYRGSQFSDSGAEIEVTYPEEVPAPTLKTRVSGNRLFVGCTTDPLYDSVQIYRSTDGTDFTEWTVLEDFVEGAASIFAADSDIRYGNTYYYYAIGHLDGVASAPSETVSYTVDFLPTPNINSCSYTCLAITLRWAGGADGDCHVFRSTDGGTTFTEVAVITDGAQEYTDASVTVGNEYIYKLQCTNESLGLESGSDEFFPITPEHREALGEQPAKEATCTEAGHTAYRACRWCGIAVSGKEEIPAKGHSMELTEEEIPATTESEGRTALYTCTACGETEGGEVIPILRDAGNGDANGDGKTTLLDLIATLHYICNPTRTIDTAAADRDANGTVDVRDVLLILQAIVNGKV